MRITYLLLSVLLIGAVLFAVLSLLTVDTEQEMPLRGSYAVGYDRS